MIIACIPAYNEGQTIGAIVKSTLPYVDLVVVCDDGSSDETAVIAESNGAIVIKHAVNQGKGAALKESFKEAVSRGGSIFVMLDGDGQHTPEDIQFLIEPILNDEADVVLGSRYVEGASSNPPFYRRVGLKIIHSVYNLSNMKNFTDTQSGFRAFNKHALSYVLNTSEKGYNIETEQLIKLGRNGLRLREVPIQVIYDVPNPSKRNPLNHGVQILYFLFNLVISEKPLQFLGIPGLIFVGAGLITTINFLSTFNYTHYFSVPWAIISMGFILFGFILILNAITLHQIKQLKGK
jgi:glycosyltransferase involved in cell wall biosynthesis